MKSDQVDEVMRVFFMAMQQGYAGSASKGKIADMPGSKTIPFESGDFKLLDCYFVNGHYSAGQTIIWDKDVPVWMMSYQGWYVKDAIPFLKQALGETYSKNEFLGGRGPNCFRSGEMIYINTVEPPNDFRHFRGREEVFGRHDLSIGWHEYQGLFLPT